MKPQPPQRPDTHKYIEKETFKFDFSSFKNSLLYLFFSVLAIGYLISGNKIENLIHGIVLLIGVGLGILGAYLFFSSFKFSTKTERVPKNQTELNEERKNYDVAYVKYEEELTLYNRKLKEEQELLEKQELRKRLEETERRDRIRRQEQERQRQEELRRQQELRLRAQQRAEEQARLHARIASYRNNWVSFQTVLQQNNITNLYHFTDQANLPSIRQQGGLLSWYCCQQNNITIPKPGGSPTSWILDERKGLQNFVRVSFVRDHPMMFVAQNDGRITNPVILEINPEVIYFRDTRYASQNAAKNGVTAEGTLEKFNSIKFPILRQRYFDLSVEDKPFYQAEVLISEKLPLEYIVTINHV